MLYYIDRKVVNVANTRAGTSIVLDNYRVQSIINLNNVTNKEGEKYLLYYNALTSKLLILFKFQNFK